MQLQLSKRHIPLLFLVFISAFWSYFYTHDIWFNDYGKSKNEIWLIIDIFFTIPLVCFLFFDKDRKQALIKSLAFMGLLIWLGSYIIPPEEKNLWKYLVNIRYIGIFAVILFEIFIIFTVIFAIKTSFENNQDPDLAINEPLEKFMGKTLVTKLMQFDIRLWVFALFPKKIKSDNYIGKHFFYGDLKDGTHSFLQGFVFILLFEMPIMHVFLHFIWSPLAANIITGTSIFSLAYFIAQYRAIAKRPISFDKKNLKLIIRYGLNNPLQLKFTDIKHVKINKMPVYRNSKIKRFNLVGIPNIEIEVINKQFDKIYLGLNNPSKFIKILQEHLNV